MSTLLTRDTLAAALTQLPGWAHEDHALVVRWKFPTFGGVLDFMADAREAIDQADHHPTWTNTYNRLDIRLTTHDAGNRVTTKDVELAKTLTWLAEHHQARI